MLEFLNKIPAGYRKFVIVLLSLVLFFILVIISHLFIKSAEGLAMVIFAEAGGIFTVASFFYKANKDVHIQGKGDNAAL